MVKENRIIFIGNVSVLVAVNDERQRVSADLFLTPLCLLGRKRLVFFGPVKAANILYVPIHGGKQVWFLRTEQHFLSMTTSPADKRRTNTALTNTSHVAHNHNPSGLYLVDCKANGINLLCGKSNILTVFPVGSYAGKHFFLGGIAEFFHDKAGNRLAYFLFDTFYCIAHVSSRAGRHNGADGVFASGVGRRNVWHLLLRKRFRLLCVLGEKVLQSLTHGAETSVQFRPF